MYQFLFFKKTVFLTVFFFYPNGRCCAASAIPPTASLCTRETGNTPTDRRGRRPRRPAENRETFPVRASKKERRFDAPGRCSVCGSAKLLGPAERAGLFDVLAVDGSEIVAHGDHMEAERLPFCAKLIPPPDARSRARRRPRSA